MQLTKAITKYKWYSAITRFFIRVIVSMLVFLWACAKFWKQWGIYNYCHSTSSLRITPVRDNCLPASMVISGFSYFPCATTVKTRPLSKGPVVAHELSKEIQPQFYIYWCHSSHEVHIFCFEVCIAVIQKRMAKLLRYVGQKTFLRQARNIWVFVSWDQNDCRITTGWVIWNCL